MTPSDFLLRTSTMISVPSLKWPLLMYAMPTFFFSLRTSRARARAQGTGVNQRVSGNMAWRVHVLSKVHTYTGLRVPLVTTPISVSPSAANTLAPSAKAAAHAHRTATGQRHALPRRYAAVQ